MHAQALMTGLLIAAAAVYLAWKWWPRRAARSRAPDNCCGCPGCPPTPKGEPPASVRPDGGR